MCVQKLHFSNRKDFTRGPVASERVPQTFSPPKGRYLEAVRHIRFISETYEMHTKTRGHHLQEHPAGATSWKLRESRELMESTGVELIYMDRFAFGVCIRREKRGIINFAQKTNTFLASCPEIAI